MESEEVRQDEDELQDPEYSVIPVQLVDAYDTVSLNSPSNSSNHVSFSRGKYYKQTYRPVWEQMPDFKGWLQGVEGEPTRAFCTYCHKTLHAHRLSLLKHTCTIRHQKAAQLHNSRKNKGRSSQSSREADNQDVHTVILNEETVVEEEEDGEHQTVEYVEAGDMEEGDTDHENEIEDDEDGENSMDYQSGHIRKNSSQQSNVTERTPISTHVVDMIRGRPVSGLQVSLYKLIDGRWTYINEGLTNSAGRFGQFVERADFTPGRYKLHYDVDRYFEAKKQETLYPFIEIVFDSTVYTESYHIPVLLSPFGYTTYKG